LCFRGKNPAIYLEIHFCIVNLWGKKGTYWVVFKCLALGFDETILKLVISSRLQHLLTEKGRPLFFFCTQSGCLTPQLLMQWMVPYWSCTRSALIPKVLLPWCACELLESSTTVYGQAVAACSELWAKILNLVAPRKKMDCFRAHALLEQVNLNHLLLDGVKFYQNDCSTDVLCRLFLMYKFWLQMFSCCTFRGDLSPLF